MKYTSFIARRYLTFRRKTGAKNFISFLTFIAIMGVMLGVSALIITVTILGGFEKQIKEKVVGFTTHIQVTGFQNIPFPHYEKSVAEIKDISPVIAGVSPFVSKEGMVRFKDNIEGILVKGIDPSHDVSSVRKYLVNGSFDLPASGAGIPPCVIGKRLAQKLGAGLNDTLIVFGLTGSYGNLRQPRIMAFRVEGMYESGMSEYDDVYFFTNISAAQELFMLGPQATGFDIMLSDVSQASVIAGKIMDTMGYPFYARTMYQLYRNLFTWVELQEKPTPIILGLIIIVATVNIIGTLLMVVMEKTRQIGILKSMGASRKGIKRIFLYEGIVIGLTGTVLGNIFAFVVCWVQLQYRVIALPSQIYFMSSVPILLRWESFAVVSAISLILCAMASYIPSTLASRLDPIRSIRFS
jgi:lipoprotein-releasing system permease protein